jgi:outer membrane protein OmpU
MKNILIATTALVATVGIAHAEVAVSGSAAAGLKYNSQTAVKTIVMSKANVAFDASGETDGGLQFGFNTNHIVTNNGSVDNDDTTVFMSGTFGKLSFGAVAEADEVAGLADIGWDGLAVDDVAEAFVGDELGEFTNFGGISHNVNYTYATGPIAVALSARLDTSNAAAGNSSYAAGAKYTFGTGYVGLGYASHQNALKTNKANVVSLFGGVNVNNIKVSGLYSDASITLAGVKEKAKAYGLNAAYSMDALTLSVGMSKSNFAAATGLRKGGLAPVDGSAFGIGASYNLGGGASVSGGIARVESVNDEGVGGLNTKETRADFGVKFSF